MRSALMSCLQCLLILAVTVWAGMSPVVRAEEPVTTPVTPENVVDPGPNELDEPRAATFSLAKAVHFLDSASLEWQKTRGCMSCHTNYAYLYSRPYIDSTAPAHQAVRKFAEQLVTERWVEKGPRWDAEVVATAAALAANDAATTRTLHPISRQALDKMWTVQQADGGWKWLKCNWPPMESDDHYGVELALIATGIAPDNYAETPAAKAGLDKIRSYLKANPPTMQHHEMMLLWGSTLVPEILTTEQQQAIQDKIWALQKPDGGWSTATLGNWQRSDKDEPQDLEHSDGYGTGFSLVILRKAGVPATDPRIQKGVAWLKANQRESGRWISRSLFKDNRHFLSHAGTAFSILALAECDAGTQAQTKR